jgi:hypothetical protein
MLATQQSAVELDYKKLSSEKLTLKESKCTLFRNTQILNYAAVSSEVFAKLHIEYVEFSF